MAATTIVTKKEVCTPMSLFKALLTVLEYILPEDEVCRHALGLLMS